MNTTRWCAVGSALCLGQIALGSIVNGGFEPAPGSPTYQALPGGSAAINGWTTTHSGIEWFRPSSYHSWNNSPNGGWIVDLVTDISSGGGIEQTFATVFGSLYQVDFLYGSSLRFGRDGTAEITVAAGGTSQLFSISNTSSDIVWETRSFSFTANSASTTLSFLNVQDANLHFAFIDGVAVTIVPAPAVASLALIGGIGALGRRKR